MTKTLTCREHNGTFTVEARRGRPPVRCSTENPCTALANDRKRVRATPMQPPRGRRTPIEREADSKAQRDAEAVAAAKRRAVKPVTAVHTEPEIAAAKRTAQTPSVTKAHAAKALLEPLGWHCTARAVNSAQGVELTASRSEELLTIVWQAGSLVSQNYSLWSTTRPRDNKQPKHELPFDPDEMPDKMLVEALSGCKVTWWNRIAQATETAVVSPDKVSISHTYNATGDEMPSDRVISFVDHAGSGFRSFRAGALLKIGK